MIEKIAETLAKPEAWTQGAYARTAKGNMIGPHCANAKCFCLEGAIILNVPAGERRIAFRLVHEAIRDLFPRSDRAKSTPIFNDHPTTTHADIVRVLGRARELELRA